jgi:hypothetical protein
MTSLENGGQLILVIGKFIYFLAFAHPTTEFMGDLVRWHKSD